MIISWAYPPVAAQLLIPLTVSALFSNTVKTQVTEPYVGKFQGYRVFLYHCSSLAILSHIALTGCIVRPLALLLFILFSLNP